MNFGGTDYVVRLPGKRTALLGIDREAECIANKAAAELGMAPQVAALLDEPSRSGDRLRLRSRDEGGGAA